MNIAVVGCSHGELNLIYDCIRKRELEENIKADLLLCCGDFQAIRDESDLEELSCPPKYKHYRDFRDYYNGKKVAPILTIFVGGNHEAPSFLKELYFGGWVAENIYYLGHSGVVKVNGIRIAGLSGIYDHRDYSRGFFEKRPYSERTKRSAYHIREFDIKKLELIKEPVDIFISHDWPRGIERFGNLEGLLKRKPFLRTDIEEGRLGNPSTSELLKKLKPRYWFSAHMHTKYEAVVKHDEGETSFMALDKPVGNRSFLEFVKVEPVGEIESGPEVPITISYDVEWLSILKANSDKMPMNSFRSSVELSLVNPSVAQTKEVQESLEKATQQNTKDASEHFQIQGFTEESVRYPKRQRDFFMSMLGLDDNNYFSPDLDMKFTVSYIPE